MFGMLIGVWFGTGKKVKEVKKKQTPPAAAAKPKGEWSIMLIDFGLRMWLGLGHLVDAQYLSLLWHERYSPYIRPLSDWWKEKDFN